MPEFELTVRLVLGLILTLSGSVKLVSRDRFRSAVREYDLLGDGAAEFAARVIPPLELVIGVALLCGVAPPIAAGGAAVLMLLFSTAMVANLRRGRRVDCGCFVAGGSSLIRPALVWRNAALGATAVFVAISSRGVLGVRATTAAARTLSGTTYVASLLLAMGVLTAYALTTTALSFRTAWMKFAKPDGVS